MDSFIGWIGGKRLLRNKIIEQFPDDIGRYIEVFGGAGWVLFARDKHAKMEVYNDANGELVNLFRCVKHHTPELQRLLQNELNSRETFNEYLQNRRNPFKTDIQRAVEFLILVKTSYGCSLDSFGCTSKNLNNTSIFLSRVQERLKKVVIENQDFEKICKIYDRPEALFYVDPPYFNTEKYYQIDFSKEDHERLYHCLKNIKGRFVLSYNDCPYIRKLYKEYEIMDFTRNNNLINRYENKSHNFSEILIKNY